MKWFLIKSLIGSATGLVLFIFGFFNIHIPNFSGQNKIIEDIRLTNESFDRTVIVVIDALRYDFLNNTHSMPYLTKLINEQNSCFVPTKVDTPTVTMPRIKALTTGTVTNFLDVLLNFASKEIKEDSIVSKAVQNKKHVIFYGDETWLKMFPNMFLRSEGTTSFFVSDYTEVDNNVTRHLDNELNAPDWNIMILHYLGLDHIGHMEGPFSPLINPKLKEMDDVIKKIHHSLLLWELSSSKKSLIIICGDHGMKNSGGHGGATIEETTVPFVSLGIYCPKNMFNAEISQIDIAPTLAILLGLNPPSDSIGKLIPFLLHHLSVHERLHILKAYYSHLYHKITNVEDVNKNIDVSSLFSNAVHLHNDYLKNNFFDVKKIESLYMLGITEMSNELSHTKNGIDAFTIAISFLMFFTTIILHCLPTEKMEKYSIQISMLYFSKSMITHTFILFISFTLMLSLHLNIKDTVFLILCVIFLLDSILYIYNNIDIRKLRPEIHKYSYLLLILMAGNVIYLLSFISSSFVEEEHQIWYFYGSSIFIYGLYRTVCDKKVINFELVKWLFLLFFHRIIRKLNQTGDKYASLPDISDWLIKKNNKLYLSIYYFTSLCGLLIICCNFTNNKITKLLILGSLIGIYCHKSITGSINNFYTMEDNRGIVEAQIVFALVLIIIVVFFWNCLFTKCTKSNLNKTLSQDLMEIIIISWIIISALLMRPHNISLSLLMVFTTHVVKPLVNESKTTLIVFHIWLGNIFFFYQGNSNSLATIDIASAYVGQTSYNQVYIAILLAIHTYSLPIFSLLLLMYDFVQKSPTDRKTCIYTFYRVTSLERLSCLFFFTIIMILHSNHLFVWSVFSPKLVYELFKYVFVFIFIEWTYVFISLFNLKTHKSQR